MLTGFNEYIKIDVVIDNCKNNGLNFSSETYKQFDKVQNPLVLVTVPLFVESDFCAKRRIIGFVGNRNKWRILCYKQLLFGFPE